MPEFKRLLDGYRRFREGEYHAARQRWEELAEGQEPPVMVIGCCDSRVDPATIFDTQPGQAFILRNVANLVPPYETDGGLHGASAAIEFGVTSLKVAHIVVVGHGACGGISAALGETDRNAAHSFIDQWISIIDEPRTRILADPMIVDKQLALELEAIKLSIANLRTFPFVEEQVAAGNLKLHGCHFTIAEGQLFVLDEFETSFHPV